MEKTQLLTIWLLTGKCKKNFNQLINQVLYIMPLKNNLLILKKLKN